MPHADETETPTTFVFPGGWKSDIESRLDSLKQFAETPAMQKFVAKHEDNMETVVTITERRRTT